ncbi:hypothetical protein [Streptacidiphilus carbonis]|uniref:hypothetical protein n=1 Tax=Streptacidiphilus carbonis TaxID=105422 RepID=UPI0005A86983|nr:hypothetical protein [Streptacidiphilus carbonis]
MDQRLHVFGVFDYLAPVDQLINGDPTTIAFTATLWWAVGSLLLAALVAGLTIASGTPGGTAREAPAALR